MKKLLVLSLALLFSASAFADPNDHPHHRRHRRHHHQHHDDHSGDQHPR